MASGQAGLGSTGDSDAGDKVGRQLGSITAKLSPGDLLQLTPSPCPLPWGEGDLKDELVHIYGRIVLTKFDALLSAIAKSLPSTKSSPVRSVTTYPLMKFEALLSIALTSVASTVPS